MVCANITEIMQRVHPKARALESIEAYSSLKPLSSRELERISLTLRFLTDIPDIIPRIAAEGARNALNGIAKDT